MNHAIQIRIRPAEGSFVRAVGLAERRGFQLLSANLQGFVGGYHQLSLVVRSPDRSVDVLKRQLERLHDVIDVMITASDAHIPQEAPQARLAMGVY
jgi:acetolactate synthase regulatory subunit